MEAQQMMEVLLARMNASMKEHMQEIAARMDANQAEMKADRKAHQAKMNTKHKEMMAILDAHHERMRSVLERRRPIQRIMQSTEGHQEIPKGEAAVMSVGEQRKRRRVRNLAAERHQKVKERTRGKSGSRRKSAATCRKVSRRAKVAW
jgi:hypothetical protein